MARAEGTFAHSDGAKPSPRTADSHRPLVVDLDGTLVRSDMLIENAFSCLGHSPLSIFGILSALYRGKAAFKHHLASRFDFDPALLPYDEAVLREIRQAREAGRPVYLASASNERIVAAIAAHVGDFAGWFASNASSNLAGETKARHLVDAFGERGFDYIGNAAPDLRIWPHAANRMAVRAPASVARRLAAIDPNATHLSSASPALTDWIKLIRVHQYVKNALVFVALLAAHAFTLDAFFKASLAAIAFSLCASGVYVLNDLVDLAADRAHPTKRFRPLAAGTIPLMHGIIAVPILFLAALAVALQVSPLFTAVLLAYFVLTTAYSFYLKRKVLLDAVVLSLLYTMRVVGGAAAIGVVLSEWLAAFSMFIFTALALIKRYVELAAVPNVNPNRGYRVADIEIIPALSAASGFNAVTVFALYATSDTVPTLYRTPQLLWLVCPLLIYWIGTALMSAHRGEMQDDPLIYALKDRRSLITAVLIAVVMIAASL